MPFPKTDREIYKKNPLAEVVAHLRFPTILKIDAESPAQFQDLLRDKYPLYQQVVASSQIPHNAPQQIKNLIQGMGGAAGPKQHIFETQDKTFSIILSRESLAFKTTTYTQWSDFSTRFEEIRNHLEQIYRPNTYTRIGLRYVDVIRRSLLGLSKVPWSELIKPNVVGELGTPELGDNVDTMNSNLHCKLDSNNCFLTLKTGIALTEPNTTGQKEKCFLIDGDFHTHNPVEASNVKPTLDTFNRFSGNLFRWSIQPKLRDALEPQPV